MIPKRVLKLLKDDPRMKRCERCGGKDVQFHHVFQYKRKQIQEYFNIAAACVKCHAKATPHNNKYKQEVREFFEWKAIQRMTTENLHKYYKKNWGTHARYLAIKAHEYGWS